MNERSSIPVEAQAVPDQPVAEWQYRMWWNGDGGEPMGWGDWQKVKPRSRLSTVDDMVAELRGYIAKGQRYELRPLFTRPTPAAADLHPKAQRIADAATLAASIAVWMVRMEAEEPDADDRGVSGWLEEAETRVKARMTLSFTELLAASSAPLAARKPNVFGRVDGSLPAEPNV